MKPQALCSIVAAVALMLLPLGAAPFAAEPSLDPTFGTNGFARTTIQPGYNETPYALLVQPDDRILTAGIGDGPAGWFLSMTRHLSGGTPDTSFGAAGIIAVHYVARDHANAIALQSDGKIVAVGMQNESNGFSSQIPSIYRFNADGSIDSLFASNGASVGRWDPVSCGEMSAVAVLPDGKILAAGRCSANANGGTNGFGLRRLLADGSPDASYDGGSQVHYFVSPNAGLLFTPPAVAFTTDFGALMASTFFRNGRIEFGVLRVDADGEAVPLGGGGGMLFPDIPIDNQALSIARLADDSFLIGASAPRPGAPFFTDFAVYRFTAAGDIDSTFGVNGTATVQLSPYADVMHGMAIAPDGKILLCGSTNLGNAGLVRLSADGTPDATFGTNGVFIINLAQFNGSNWLTRLRFDNQQRLLAAGYDFSSGNGDFVVARFGASPTPVNGSVPSLPNLTLIAFPNPAGANVVFGFDLPEASQTRLEILDVAGRRVATLTTSTARAGSSEMHWDGRTTEGDMAPSGVYFARVEARDAGGVIHRGSTKVIRLK